MCTKTTTSDRFSALGAPDRIWAIPAIHSDVDKLIRLHDELLEHFVPGDRLVYMGNYIGYGYNATATIDEILAFRRMLLSVPGVLADDIVFLRGSQEEMFAKLLQLQFAPDPASVLKWMLANGMERTLYAYGLDPEEGMRCTREGVMGLNRWIGKIRSALRREHGHEMFFTHLRRAAYTDKSSSHPLLFVHSGVDPARPLDAQGDSFWWAGRQFNAMTSSYDPFARVIRGFDPDHNGLYINGVISTIDDGCGFGGSLLCAGIDAGGSITECLEA